MKNNNNLLVILAALFTLSACSSAPKTQTASVDDLNIDELLSERAIAQVQVGGELLVKAIGALSSASEKQALVRLIEKTAQEQGISVVKGMKITSGNVGTAFTETEAASIVKALSATQSKLFSRPAMKQIAAEADVALAKAKAAQSANGNAKLASNIDLTDKATLGAVKNLHYGFGKNPEYVKTYITVKRLTNVDLWSESTCTTFKKLDQVAAGNLLVMGKNQAGVAKYVATSTAGQGSEKTAQCMIKKGAAQALNDFVNVLHVPAAQAVNTLEIASGTCNLFPRSYASAGKALVQGNKGVIPAVNQVICN